MSLMARVTIYRDTDPEEVIDTRVLNVFGKIARWGFPDGGVIDKVDSIRLKGCCFEFIIDDLTKAEIDGVFDRLC